MWRNLSGTRYVPMAQALPMDAWLKTATALQQRYDENPAQLDKLGVLANNLKALPMDAGVKNSLLDEVRKANEEIAKTGAWETAGSRIRQIANKMASDPRLSAMQQRYEAHQQNLKQAQEMGATPDQLWAYQQSLNNLSPLDKPDATGAYAQLNPYEFFKPTDRYKTLDELMKGYEPHKTTKFDRKGGFIYQIDSEELSAQELLGRGVQRLLQDPQMRRQLVSEARYQSGDPNLSGEALQKAVMDLANRDAAIYADKYDRNNQKVDQKVDAYAMNAIENAQQNARQQAGFAHQEKMRMMDKSEEANANLPLISYSNALTKDNTNPGSYQVWKKSLGESDALIKDRQTRLKDKNLDPKLRASYESEIRQAQASKSELSSIRDTFYNARFKGAELEIAKALGAPDAPGIKESLIETDGGIKRMPTGKVPKPSELRNYLAKKGVFVSEKQAETVFQKIQSTEKDFEKNYNKIRDEYSSQGRKITLSGSDASDATNHVRTASKQVFDANGNLREDLANADIEITDMSTSSDGSGKALIGRVPDPASIKGGKATSYIPVRVKLAPGDNAIEALAERNLARIKKSNSPAAQKVKQELSNVMYNPYMDAIAGLREDLGNQKTLPIATKEGIKQATIVAKNREKAPNLPKQLYYEITLPDGSKVEAASEAAATQLLFAYQLQNQKAE